MISMTYKFSENDFAFPDLDIKQRQHVLIIRFLQFLNYAKTLDYKTELLEDINYRCVVFRLRDFIHFQNPNQQINTYQLTKFKKFFHKIEKKFKIDQSDNSYISFVVIGKVEIEKKKGAWIARIWIVSELFCHPELFQFENLLNGSNLNKHQMAVLAQLIAIYYGKLEEKRCHPYRFFHLYSPLSIEDEQKVQQYFLDFMKCFSEQKLIDNKIKIEKMTNSGYKYEFHNIEDLHWDLIKDGFRLLTPLNQ